jgi:hypothetical protein
LVILDWKGIRKGVSDIPLKYYHKAKGLGSKEYNKHPYGETNVQH